MTLTDKRQFKVIDYGSYNRCESGPDFLNAKIQIDQMTWCGNVEIHIKSSDWFSHCHHLDKAYDTVILHVVYQSNRQIIQNGFAIPELETKHFIDPNHHSNYIKFSKVERILKCENQLQYVPEFLWGNFLNNYFWKRLNRKTNEISSAYSYLNAEDIYIRLLAASMGSKINQIPFQMLADNLMKFQLREFSPNEQRFLVMFISGLFFPLNTSEDAFFKKHILPNDLVLPKNIWKFGGSRPNNFPTIRVAQFADILIETLKLNPLNWENPKIAMAIINIIDKQNLSGNFKRHLKINALMVFLFWLSEKTANQEFVFLIAELIKNESAEFNHVVKKWGKSTKKVISLRDSQALLEIFQQLCLKNKCLSCEIGKFLLEE